MKHRSGGMNKQPAALEQYHTCNDFIYSFNTRMSFSSLHRPPGPTVVTDTAGTPCGEPRSPTQ